MLRNIIDNNLTDKNTMHSYIDTYQELFEPKKDTATNVLEIGIYRGGSIKLLQEYFTNATVWALDHDPDHIPEFIYNLPRVNVVFGDAYTENLVNNRLIERVYDIIIEDGAHTLDGVKFVAEHYAKLLAPGGVLVIEDVQDMSWIDIMRNLLPENLRDKSYVVDNRNIKGRYDDVLFIVKNE